jgi:SAM-dependent methyltransferase
MSPFLRKQARREPIPVTMSGIRMGERLLQVGVDDPAVAGALAAKVGLSGSAAAVAADATGAEKARASAAEAGVLMDVQTSSLHALPHADDAFDVVVIHSVGGLLPRLDVDTRAALARESRRVLRPGGRLVVIEPGTARGMSAMLGRAARPDPDYSAGGGTLALLEAAGFRPVRVVGDVDGFTFIEGLKS